MRSNESNADSASKMENDAVFPIGQWEVTAEAPLSRAGRCSGAR